MKTRTLRISCVLTYSTPLYLCVLRTSALGMSLGFSPVFLLRDGEIAKIRFAHQLLGGLDKFLTNLLRLPFCRSSLRGSKSIQLCVGIGLTGMNMHMVPFISDLLPSRVATVSGYALAP